MRNTPSEDIDFGKRYARTQLSNLTGKLRSRKLSYYSIKSHLQYPDLCQAADYIEKNVNKINQDLIFGNPLPKNYEELGVCEFSITAEQLVNEINWTLISIRKFSFHINLFIIYKEDFESSILRGDYADAEKHLTKIENEICCSLWTLENRFLLKELDNKSSENKDFLSKFNEINKSSGYTKSLANYLSNRAEKTLSVNRFHSDLQFALSKLDTQFKEEHSDYYMFKLSFLNHLEYTNFSEILGYDFEHSVIDRYLTLRKVLTILLTTANNKLDTLEEGKTIRDYLVNRLGYILKKIKDPIMSRLKLFASDKIFPAFDELGSKIEIHVIDKYTTGQYQDVESELKELLILKPSQFDLYILYVKSLIYQKKEFQIIGNPKSIQNQILSNIYKIISATGSPNDASLNLLRIANNLTSSVLSYGIIDFVNYRTTGKNERSLFAKLSYNPANPIVYEVLIGEEAQINYLSMLKNRFPDSITIEFLLNKLTDTDSLVKFKNIIPEAKYRIEVAKRLQNNNRYEDAISDWSYIIEHYNDTIPFLEVAIKNLYLCYEELKKFDDCIRLYVDGYLMNSFLVAKIEVDSLLLKIKENRFRVVSSIIELPLFYTIASADENEVHTAFEKFNLANKVCKPSELLFNFTDFEFSKIIFYLKFTCCLDVLRHSTNINGSRERLEERLTLIQFLKDKDLTDKEIYDAEIKYISNILIIQKGLIDLDDGKIYVNEQGILVNELKEYEAIFNRFQVIAGLTEKNKSYLFLNKGRLTQYNYNIENIESEKIEYSHNPVFDIYIELFDVIKDKFLFSKDGIVAYLSTRIRHGVLLGEIRPVFEKYKLITQKEGDSNSYRRNYYWDTMYSYEPDIKKAEFQSLLRDFSYSIDGLIFDLIKMHLQVYNNETNKDGWFNYDFDDDTLFWHSIRALNSTDYSHFVQQVFEILWDRTDDNLSLIRQKIQTSVLLQFNELFDKLESDLINVLGTHASQNIVSSIKACSTETQTVITRISSWFKRSGTSASDFHLENVIDIVLGYADKNNRIKLERSIECNCKIKGAYLKHFADLLWIFTDNILKHSDEKIHHIGAKITTNTNGNILELKIENNITNKKSLDALKNVSSNRVFDISKLLSEGKSGYHKAYKILQYDLLNTDNTIYTEVSENEEVFTVNISINLQDLIS